jgi:hypothetical protein
MNSSTPTTFSPSDVKGEIDPTASQPCAVAKKRKPSMRIDEKSTVVADPQDNLHDNDSRPDGSFITGLAQIPGLPIPETCGPHYEAEKAYVQKFGLPRPILVDSKGVVWSGGTLMNICNELQIKPTTQVVEDGPAAAFQELATRELSLLERADLVLAAYENVGTNFVLGESKKRSHAVHVWFREVLGKDRGFSQSQVEQYVHVARSGTHCRALVAKETSLHQAIRIINEYKSSATPTAQPSVSEESPSDNEKNALTAVNSLTTSMKEVKSWTTVSLIALRSLRDDINIALRARRSVAKEIAA